MEKDQRTAYSATLQSTVTCFSAQTSLPLAARLGVAFLAVDSGAITISSGFPPSSSMA